MITFQSRQLPIQYAEIIERKAHNVYPHVSNSKLNTRCEHAFTNHTVTPNFFDKVRIKTLAKLRELRSKLRTSNTFYTDLAYGMQDNRVGNCFEEACIAELIGKINGQKNIYVGDIFVEKENVKNKRKIDHTVAFITNKKIKPGKEYYFKNKDAVIIDPWLGITDYADMYFTRLKNHFKNYFKELPEQDFSEYLTGVNSKDTKEFRERRKNSCRRLKFNIKLAHNLDLNKTKRKLYKVFFPELVIKKFKKIELPKKLNQKGGYR